MDQPTLRKRSGSAQIASALDRPPLMLASVIEHVSIGSLAPYAGNSRKHDQHQVAKLCSIIKKVGMLVPLLIDDKGEIIAGHGRLLACKELGMSLVPVIRVGHLSPDQIRAFRIADNRLAELSTWDDEALAIELHHLVHSIEGPEIIELTALEIGEVDARLEVLGEKPKQDPADAAPEDAGLLSKEKLLAEDIPAGLTGGEASGEDEIT
jgi:ParB-like chromosome segregation protein Spo0J